MSALPAPAGWHGRLELALERRADRTALARSRAQMPLALQRPFYPEGEDVCHLVLLHPPGGMVGGDRLEIALELGPDAEVLVTTPSAAKWYRGASPAEQMATVRIARGAHLEWLPLETIVFDGAHASQALRVELAPGASFLAFDITRFGRSARGEGYTLGTWRSVTEVRREGRPLWIDRQRLQGGASVMRSHYGLAGQPVAGGLVWIGHAVEVELVEEARALWTTGRYAGEAGVTRLADGMLCRYRGPSSTEARAWFTGVWDRIRRRTRRRGAEVPRIWRT